MTIKGPRKSRQNGLSQSIGPVRRFSTTGPSHKPRSWRHIEGQLLSRQHKDHAKISFCSWTQRKFVFGKNEEIERRRRVKLHKNVYVRKTYIYIGKSECEGSGGALITPSFLIENLEFKF